MALLVQRDGTSVSLGEGEAILVPFGGAEHEWAAVEIAAWIAGALGTSIKLAGVASDPKGETRDASRLFGHAFLAAQRTLGIPTDPVLVPAGDEGMLSAAADASLLAMGFSSRWQLKELGQARLEVARQAWAPTLLVKHGLRPGGLAPRESLTRFTWALGR